MKLSVAERLTIMGILPSESNFVTLRLVRDLSSKVGLSADEIKEFGVEEKDGMVFWNEKGNDEVEIDFRPKEEEVVRDALTNLDKLKKLGQKHFSLYEKFVGE